MLSLPLTSADIISRRFVNIDQARQYICPRTLWYRKSLVCRTIVNSNCLKLRYGRRQRGRGWGRNPGPAPGKLQVVIYFQEEKTGTNFPREAFFLSQSKQLLRCSLVYYTQPPSGTKTSTFIVFVSSYAPGKTERMSRLV